MNILIVLSSLTGGGAERVACNLAAGWLGRGHQVSLATLGSSDEDFYQLDAGVKRLSLEVNRPSTSRLDSIKMNIVRVRSLRNAIADESSDVVISLMTTTNVRVLLSLIGKKVPVLAAEHSYPPKSTQSNFWKSMRKWIYRYASAVVALNGESAHWLKKHTSARNVVVIPNQIVWPMARVEPYVDAQSLAEGRKYFLGVGRLDRLKGFDRLIRSFSTICKELPEWDLVIIGQGSEHENLSALAASLGIENRVIFTGLVGNVVDWYERCHVFVLSSNLEGFPVALLEAMACGMPAVAVDCTTGPSDIINDGENGVLCLVDDNSLSKSMYELAIDNDTQERLSQQARTVVSTYSEETVLDLWDSLFESLGLMQSRVQNTNK